MNVYIYIYICDMLFYYSIYYITIVYKIYTFFIIYNIIYTLKNIQELHHQRKFPSQFPRWSSAAPSETRRCRHLASHRPRRNPSAALSSRIYRDLVIYSDFMVIYSYRDLWRFTFGDFVGFNGVEW